MGLAEPTLHRRWESRLSLWAKPDPSGCLHAWGMGVGRTSTPKRVRKTGGSGEFQRDATRAHALWAFTWNESVLTGLRYRLLLRAARAGRSIIKLVGYAPPESSVSFQRELLRVHMSIRAEEFSWQTDSGAPDFPTVDIHV